MKKCEKFRLTCQLDGRCKRPELPQGSETKTLPLSEEISIKSDMQTEK